MEEKQPQEFTIRVRIEATGEAFFNTDDLEILERLRILHRQSPIYIGKDGRVV